MVLGDFVVFTPQPVIAQPKPSPPEHTRAVTERDPARIALDKAFERSLGRNLVERIAIWELYLDQWKDGPYTNQIGKELAWLRQQLTQSRQPTKIPAQSKRPQKLNCYIGVPSWIYAHEPLEPAVAILEQETIEKVRLLLRRRGDVGFETIVLHQEGGHHWRALLQDARWKKPGQLEYFVEIVRNNQSQETVFGSPTQPQRIEIRADLQKNADETGRSKVESIAEFVDFKIGDQKDSFTRFETSYRYLIALPLHHSFKVGVMIFDGEGGSLPSKSV